MCQKKTEHDWMDYPADISLLRAHKPGKPMPRSGRTEEPAKIPVSQILKLATYKPLFGNKQPNRTGTHWIVFMKEIDHE